MPGPPAELTAKLAVLRCANQRIRFVEMIIRVREGRADRRGHAVAATVRLIDQRGRAGVDAEEARRVVGNELRAYVCIVERRDHAIDRPCVIEGERVVVPIISCDAPKRSSKWRDAGASNTSVSQRSLRACSEGLTGMASRSAGNTWRACSRRGARDGNVPPPWLNAIFSAGRRSIRFDVRTDAAARPMSVGYASGGSNLSGPTSRSVPAGLSACPNTATFFSAQAAKMARTLARPRACH